MVYVSPLISLNWLPTALFSYDALIIWHLCFVTVIVGSLTGSCVWGTSCVLCVGSCISSESYPNVVLLSVNSLLHTVIPLGSMVPSGFPVSRLFLQQNISFSPCLLCTWEQEMFYKSPGGVSEDPVCLEGLSIQK